MEEFKIISINENEYELAGDGDKTYKTGMNFYELKRKPEAGSSIFMSPKLLDKKYSEYSKMYYFGKPDSVYGRSPDAESYKIDTIEIELDGRRVRLQRHYG